MEDNSGFEDDNRAKKSPMLEDRRRVKIDKVFNEYLEFLKEMEIDSVNTPLGRFSQ